MRTDAFRVAGAVVIVPLCAALVAACGGTNSGSQSSPSPDAMHHASPSPDAMKHESPSPDAMHHSPSPSP